MKRSAPIRTIMLPTIWFYRYKRVDENGWTLRIGKFFWLSKFGKEKYIKTNNGKKYSLTIMGKLISF